MNFPSQPPFRDAGEVDERGKTALMRAAWTGDAEAVKILAPTSDCRAVDHNGRNALMFAANSGSLEAAQTLAPNSDLHAVDHNGCNALMWAARAIGGDAAALQSLLAMGVLDPKATDSDGRNALMWAARMGSAERVAVLLPHTDPLAVSAAGQTALMQAARYPACVALLAPVSNIFAADNKGRTALMIAARDGEPASVALLAPDSDVNAVDADGRTALDLAVECSGGFLDAEADAPRIATLLRAPQLDPRNARSAVERLMGDFAKRLRLEKHWGSGGADWDWAEHYPDSAAAFDRVLAALPDDPSGEAAALRSQALANFGSYRGEALPQTAALCERQALRDALADAAPQAAQVDAAAHAAKPAATSARKAPGRGMRL